MSSGRYTAYHIYQGLQFPEAQKAGTRPYKLPEYQCVHSQRGYLFQFDNMVERTHFDAANTTCCSDPVLNFANKPQYSESSKPMNPTDCGAKVSSVGCNVLDVRVEADNAMCAESDARIRRIILGCPELCPELAAQIGGGSVKGLYGDFRVLGAEAPNVMVVEYVPDPDLISGWYNACSGAGMISEEFCGGHSISYSLQAGLAYPGGCGCDCCGTNGLFSPPYMTLSSPSTIEGEWGNTVDIGPQVSGSEACSGADITGSFSGALGGTVEVPWEGPAQYQSDGSTRYVTRNTGPVGSENQAACCGGTIYWSGSDGCGGGTNDTTQVNATISSSQIYASNASGSGDDVLAEGNACSVSGWQACSYAASADLSVVTSCLANQQSMLNRYDGMLRRYLGYLTFSDTEDCSGCCGNGALSVSFSNGCGQDRAKTYYVRRSFSDDNLIGYNFCCQQSGSNFEIIRSQLKCNGASGADERPFSNYSSLGECINDISGAAATNISGAGGCSGSLLGSTECCWYWDNQQSGEDFRSKVFSVSGSRCCQIETDSGAWVYSGTNNPCCPQT